MLVAAGVVSILNFAPAVVCTSPLTSTLRQVDLGIELQILGFYERQAAGLATGRGAAADAS